MNRLIELHMNGEKNWSWKTLILMINKNQCEGSTICEGSILCESWTFTTNIIHNIWFIRSI
ncbi:hypothetical protein LINPERPRIM_LOCUS33137, partial [Linum perenne]